MLSERYRELLTAYVDGELTNRQRRHVAKLLRRSPEARSLLAALQRDSKALIKLPPVAAPPDLCRTIIAEIERRKLRPTSTPRVTPRYPAWVGIAAAAAVLVSVGLGSFLIFSRGDQPERLPLAKTGRDEIDESSPNESQHRLAKNEAPRTQPPRKVQPTPPRKDAPTDPDWKLETPGPDTPEKMDLPGNEPGSVLTTGQKEPFRGFEKVQLILPTVHRLSDLGQASALKTLTVELTRATALRIELPCRDATKAYERLQPLLKASKIGLTIDAVAQLRMKARLRTDYGLFIENIPASAVSGLLVALQKAEAAATSKKPSDSRFDGSIIVRAINDRDRKDLKDVLGLDPLKVRPGMSPGVDLRKPLADQTRDQVTAALEGKGIPRPGGAEQNGILFSLNPSRGKPGSKEAQTFVNQRRPVKEGTVQILLVLRTVGN